MPERPANVKGKIQGRTLAERADAIQPPRLGAESQERVALLAPRPIDLHSRVSVNLPQHVVDPALKNEAVTQQAQQEPDLRVPLAQHSHCPRPPTGRGRQRRLEHRTAVRRYGAVDLRLFNPLRAKWLY